MRAVAGASSGVLVLVALAGCGAGPDDPADRAAASINGHEIEADLRFLAHDLLEGRAPGTRGGRLAAEYIASRFHAAGLEPVDGSWFQVVPILGSTPVPASVRLTFRGGGATFEPAYRDEFVAWSGDPGAASVRAAGELVFAGYGISAPEHDWDDFEGVDVEGKILLVLVNDPPATEGEPERFEGPAMTYYGRWTYKLEEAARRGALGVLLVHETEAAGYPWSVVRGSWTGEQFALPPDPSAGPPSVLQGWVTREAAERVLALADLELESLSRRAATREFTAVGTGLTVQGGLRSRVRRIETRNVVGVRRGEERAGEVVTLTSHYDHLGVGEAVAGDSVYNGAYDNASGIALLLQVAEAFGALEEPTPRSVLFVATAAEEAGLLGAEWYVQNPLFPLHRTVAEINVDGANLWGTTDDLIAMGAERSGLGPYVEARARELGMALAPDAEPEKGYFFRSDHFPFVRAGVPSLYLEHGRRYRGRRSGWGDSIQEAYVAERYHAPGDELRDDFVFDGAVQQGKVVSLTAYDLAVGSGFPEWNRGSEFRAPRERMMQEGAER